MISAVVGMQVKEGSEGEEEGGREGKMSCLMEGKCHV